MASTSAERLSHTSELVREILIHVDEPKTLFSCAQVCKAWFEESTRILWHGARISDPVWKPTDRLVDRSGKLLLPKWRTPSFKFLRELAKSPDRFCWYVGLIDKLTLSNYMVRDLASGTSETNFLAESDFYDLFRQELWSSFRGSGIHAMFHRVEPLVADLDYLEHLVQPRLRLFCQQGHCCLKRLGQILANKSHLRILRLEPQSLLSVRAPLYQYLRMSTLRYLDLDPQKEFFENNLLWFTAMLEISSLQHLSTGGYVGDPTKFEFVGTVSKLRSLELANCSSLCSNLFRYLPSLESFRYRQQRDGMLEVTNDILEPITACLKLRELDIDCKGDITMSTDAMMNLASQTPLMERFKISAARNYNSDGWTCVSDSDRLCQAIQLWPQLLLLHFGLKTKPLHAENLLTISEGCQELCYMYILGGINMKALIKRSFVFPKLQSLGLRYLLVDISTSMTSKLESTTEDASPPYWDIEPDSESDSSSDFEQGTEFDYDLNHNFESMLLEDESLTIEVKENLLCCMPQIVDIKLKIWICGFDRVIGRLEGCAIFDGPIPASENLKNRIDPGHWLMHSIYEEAGRN